jgi:integral membrane sensor domain MASE1
MVTRERVLMETPSMFGIAFVAAAYTLLARLGLALDPVGHYATLVWPPTGVALAALLLVGQRMWPGVAIGALLANLWAGAPPLVAFAIAAGNTLEAYVGAWALQRRGNFDPALERVSDVVALILYAAVASTLISATIGTFALHLGGVVPRAALLRTWQTWWIGDVLGDLVAAPLVLSWGYPFAHGTSGAQRRRPTIPTTTALEALLLGSFLVAAGLFVFSERGSEIAPAISQPHMLFPPLIWAALRFGQRGAVTATTVVFVVAILRTVAGKGPFARPTVLESLVHLQTFMTVVAVTMLVLGAAISERRRHKGR